MGASSLTVFFVIGLAFVLANLPFVTQARFAVLRRPEKKNMLWECLELLVFYLLVGGVGLLLEKQAGQIAPQRWEFYAITFALFVTLAFPGFVYRHLWKHHG